MSKKRKYTDVSHNDNEISPPRKRIRLDKPLNKMKVSDFKKEIKKRDKNQKISGLKKHDLKSILFNQIQLSDSEIDKMDRNQIANELKMHNEYETRSSWNRNDLADYLKYINSNPNAINNKDFGICNSTKISKHEMLQMPLYKIQAIYGAMNTTNRDEIYQNLKSLWHGQQLMKREKEKYITHFFNENNGIYSIKPEIKVDNDKLLTFQNLDEFMKINLWKIQSMYSKIQIRLREYKRLQRVKQIQQKKDKYFKILKNIFFTEDANGNLVMKQQIEEDDKVVVFHNCSDRQSIHQFAENNGLFSRSVGPQNYRIIGIGRNCDRSKVFNVLLKEESKYQNQLIEQQNSKWNEMVQKNLLLKKKRKWNIFGEWVMNEDFGYGNEDRYYLYMNENSTHNDCYIYGSFLIGPIEGKLRFKTNGNNFNRKFIFEWRGRETGEGVIQIGDNKRGEIKFTEFGTSAVGVLKSDLGDFEFHVLRISDNVKIKASQYHFEGDEEEEYERERVGRWR